MCEATNAYKILVGKPEGKRPLGRHRHRWDSNIKMHLKETRREDVKLIHLAPERDRCWLGNEPSCYVKGGEFLD
jgi:hypothetical protein